MKTQTLKQETERKPQVALADQKEDGASSETYARQARPVFDDRSLHTFQGVVALGGTGRLCGESPSV